MPKLKTGSRLRSAVCPTEVMVVAAPDGEVEVACGGAAMVDIAATPPSDLSIAPDADKGTLLGKRYVNEAGDLELLCTKPGKGSLGSGDELLVLKESKPLPSSD